MDRPATDSRKELHSSPTRNNLESSVVGALELYPIDCHAFQRRSALLLGKLPARGLAQDRPAADNCTATSSASVKPVTQPPKNEEISKEMQHTSSGLARRAPHVTPKVGASSSTPFHVSHSSLPSRTPSAKDPEMRARVHAETLRCAHRLIAHQLRLRRPEAQMNLAFAANARRELRPLESEALGVPEAPRPSEAEETIPDPLDTFITSVPAPPPPPVPVPEVDGAFLQAQRNREGPSVGPPAVPDEEAEGRKELLRPFVQGSSPRTLLRGLLQPPVLPVDGSMLTGLCARIAGNHLRARSLHDPPLEDQSESVVPSDASALGAPDEEGDTESLPVNSRRLIGIPDHNRGLYAGLRAIWERERKLLLMKRARSRAKRVRTGAWWRLADSAEGMAVSARKRGLGVETYRLLLKKWNVAGVDYESLFAGDSDADEMRRAVELARRLAQLHAANLATPSMIAGLMAGDEEILRQIDALAAANPNVMAAGQGDFHSMARAMLKEKRRAGGKRTFRSDAQLADDSSAAPVDKHNAEQLYGFNKGVSEHLGSEREDMQRQYSSYNSERFPGSRDKSWRDTDSGFSDGIPGLPSLRLPGTRPASPSQDTGLHTGDRHVSQGPRKLTLQPSPFPTSLLQRKQRFGAKKEKVEMESFEMPETTQTQPPSSAGSHAQEGVDNEFDHSGRGRRSSEWWARNRATSAGKRTRRAAGGEDEHSAVGEDYMGVKYPGGESSRRQRQRHPSASSRADEAPTPSLSFKERGSFGNRLSLSRDGEKNRDRASWSGLDKSLHPSKRHSWDEMDRLLTGDSRGSLHDAKGKQSFYDHGFDNMLMPFDFASLVDTTSSDALMRTPGELSSGHIPNDNSLSLIEMLNEASEQLNTHSKAHRVLDDLDISEILFTDSMYRSQLSPDTANAQLRRVRPSTSPSPVKEDRVKEDEESKLTSINLKALRERFAAAARQEYEELWNIVQQLREQVRTQEEFLAECRNDVYNIANPASDEDRDVYAIRLTCDVNKYAQTNHLDLRQLSNTIEAEGDHAEAVRAFLESFALTRGRHAGRDVSCQCTAQDLGYVDETLGSVEEQMAGLYFHSRKLAHAIKMTIASIGNVMSFHSLLELEATCKRCFFIFEDPRTLWPCGHTFCQSCLEDMFTLRGDLICNECGTTCSVGYTPNLSLELLASYQVMQRSSVDSEEDGLDGASVPQRGTIEGVLASVLHDFMSKQSVLIYAPRNTNRGYTAQES